MAGSNDTVNEVFSSQKKRTRNTIILFLVIVVGMMVYSSLTGAGSIEIAIDSKAVGVSGPESMVNIILFDDITDVELMEEFAVGEAVEAVESDNTYLGTYQNEQLGEYTIIAYQKCSSMIAVTTAEGVFVFNSSTASRTQEYYTALVEAIEAYYE